MNIKFSVFKSALHDPSRLDETSLSFLKEIETELGCALTLSELNDYQCDLKLLFVQTGGSEGLFLNSFDKLKEPYYLLTNGNNNSLAASLEILTYLNKIGKHGEILHGGAKYVAKRISDLAAVSSAAERLKKAKLGILGKPSDWLIASVPDYTEVKNKLGITLVDVPLSEVERKAENYKPNKEKTSLYAPYDDKEMSLATGVLDALEEIVAENKLDGLTIRCFDLLSSLKTTGCLALAELNRKGIVGTCEGDVAAMISMLVIKALTDKSSFQANPSNIDAENNTAVLAHCTVPFDMVESYKFDTHFESGIGVAVKGEMPIGKVTVFRISSDLKRYFVSAGTILNNLDDKNLCRTQIKIKFDKPVDVLLKEPCGNHHVVVYGDHVGKIEQLMELLLKTR